MAYTPSNRGAAARGNNNNVGRGRAPQQQPAQQQQGNDRTPSHGIQQKPKDGEAYFVGSAWELKTKKDGSPITRKDGTPVEGALSAIIRIDECEVEQDNQGRSIIRVTLWPQG